MASAADRKRRKRARSQTVAMQVAAERAGGDGEKLVEPKPKRAEPKRLPGLQWLLSKGKITRPMYEAGERYAVGVRVASCVDASAVRSCLGALEGGRGGGPVMPRVRSAEELEGAEWIAEYQRQTVFVRTRLFDDVDLMGVLDSIAIRQLTPREITQHQREAEDIEAVAWTVLKLLVNILREYDNPPQVFDGQLACAA